jgi:hypothetical protein
MTPQCARENRPAQKFWIVRLAGTAAYGPFGSQREADRFAASHGMVTSNFVVPVYPPEQAERAA